MHIQGFLTIRNSNASTRSLRRNRVGHTLHEMAVITDLVKCAQSITVTLTRSDNWTQPFVMSQFVIKHHAMRGRFTWNMGTTNGKRTERQWFNTHMAQTSFEDTAPWRVLMPVVWGWRKPRRSHNPKACIWWRQCRHWRQPANVVQKLQFVEGGAVF